MFRTSKCSSAGRLAHAALRDFFHAEIKIKGYMNSSGPGSSVGIETDYGL
jgi:hypothetical protein